MDKKKFKQRSVFRPWTHLAMSVDRSVRRSVRNIFDISFCICLLIVLQVVVRYVGMKYCWTVVLYYCSAASAQPSKTFALLTSSSHYLSLVHLFARSPIAGSADHFQVFESDGDFFFHFCVRFFPTLSF